MSDAILDATLAGDKQPQHARVAVETLFKTGLCVVAGEVRTSAVIDVPSIVRRTINRIGFDHSDKGFDGRICAVTNVIEGQSPDIAMGVDAGRMVFILPVFRDPASSWSSRSSWAAG